jgi:putative salt-induced outer membrane protein
MSLCLLSEGFMLRFLLIFILLCASSNLFAVFMGEESATINLTGGNTDLKTYTLESNNKYSVKKNSFSLKGAYRYGESSNVRVSENWNGGLRYDHKLNPKYEPFIGELVEADRFSGIKRRYNTDLGLKYTFSATERSDLFIESGLRYTIEKSTDRSIVDKKAGKGRIYLEGGRKIKNDMTIKLWLEYLPNFSESDDYQINFEPSLNMTLTSILSMKTAYLWQYDNVPAVNTGKHDYNFNLTLIAKF